MSVQSEPTTSNRRALGIVGIILASILTLALVAVVFLAINLNPALANEPESGSDSSTPAPTSTPSPTASPVADGTDLEQCRVDAVVAYMKAQGFEDGDYVIGEENLDETAPELIESGSLAFGKNGANVMTRKQLEAVFESTSSELRPVVNAQVAKFPSLGEDIVLNTANWELVQSTKEGWRIQGNTGLIGTKVVSMGTRESAAGDAAWLFINSDTCVVEVAEVQPATAKAGDPPAVGLIRVGCINPGDNLVPAPKPTTPPRGDTPPHEPPPTTPPSPKIIGEAPQRTGNLPTQHMPNPLPASPEHFQPAEPPAPPVTYVPPAEAPAPAPAPVPAPGGGTIPAPAPEPAPVPTTTPVEPAPAPTDPGTNTSCAPGQASC